MTHLMPLAERWLQDIAGQLDPETADLYRMHFRAHLVPHFGTLDGITPEALGEYTRKRLKVVKRRTLSKERSTLRGFLAWCEETGLIADAPELPKLPRKAQGTPYAVRRRGKATWLEPEECWRLVAALPLWSEPRGGSKPYPIQARYVVMLEYGLRPATLDALSVPEHYQRGATHLAITDLIDKVRFGRDLPLGDRARAALDSVLPTRGLIFGKHNYRRHLERAAAKVLDPARARTFTAYDLRHARATELAGTGDLPGAQYILGHKRLETTGIYVRPGIRAAQRALDKASGTVTRQSRGLVTVQIHEQFPAGAKRGSRTPKPVKALEPESSVPELVSAATSLIRCARDGVCVDATELYAFARLALESTELGRLALAVLDGGAFAPMRAVELATLIVESAGTAATEGAES